MKILFIHGHGATSRSWAYIEQNLPPADRLYVDYAGNSRFEDNLTVMKRQLVTSLGAMEQPDVFIVAHSLGGIYALHLLEELGERVAGVVSLSTPFAGSRAADTLKYFFPTSSLLRDVGPNDDPIAHSRRVRITCPWTALISTAGHSRLWPEDNDGVVTLRSMTCRDDMRHIRLDINHSEILLYTETVNIIKNCYVRLTA
jgi:pimeloyl-ACP methyl ester carboxylesterase